MVRKSGNYHRKDIIETFEKRDQIFTTRFHWCKSIKAIYEGIMSFTIFGRQKESKTRLAFLVGVAFWWYDPTPYEWNLQVKTETGKATTFLEREAPQKKYLEVLSFWVSKKRLGYGWKTQNEWWLNRWLEKSMLDYFCGT